MKIAIVGAAYSFAEAPFDDPRWQIWACGDKFCMGLPRVDRFFEIHAAEGIPVQGKRYERFIAETDAEVWVMDPKVRADAIMYPRQRIIDLHGTEFLSSSVAWMMALAIDEGAAEIGLWGVDMATDSEYAEQRAGCKYFEKQARGRGISVTYPAGCPLAVDLPPYPENAERIAV